MLVWLQEYPARASHAGSPSPATAEVGVRAVRERGSQVGKQSQEAAKSRSRVSHKDQSGTKRQPRRAASTPNQRAQPGSPVRKPVSPAIRQVSQVSQVRQGKLQRGRPTGMMMMRSTRESRPLWSATCMAQRCLHWAGILYTDGFGATLILRCRLHFSIALRVHCSCLVRRLSMCCCAGSASWESRQSS